MSPWPKVLYATNLHRDYLNTNFHQTNKRTAQYVMPQRNTNKSCHRKRPLPHITEKLLFVNAKTKCSLYTKNVNAWFIFPFPISKFTNIVRESTAIVSDHYPDLMLPKHRSCLRLFGIDHRHISGIFTPSSDLNSKAIRKLFYKGPEMCSHQCSFA